MFQRVLWLVIASISGTVAAGTLEARTPKSLVTAAVAFPAGDFDAAAIALPARLTNRYDARVRVRFEALDQPGLSLAVVPAELELEAGASTDIRLTGKATAARKQAVFLRGWVTTEDGSPIAETAVEAHLRVAQDAAGGLRAVGVGFNALFVTADRERLPGVGFAYASRRGIPPGPREDLAARAASLRLPAAPAGEVTASQGPESTSAAREATQKLTVSGQFRWVDSQGVVRNGWGWVAQLYSWNGTKWVDSHGWAYVGQDAKFSVTGTVPLAGYTRIVLSPSNAYFYMVNNSNQRFQVALPQFATDEVTYNYGSHYVDYSQSGTPGVGEIHRRAYDLWVRLNAVGIDPKYASAIKVVYPTTHDCGSCSLGGTVLISAVDGTSFHTIRHELGHELMWKFWGDLPEGSGGFHVWPNCANEGLALSEGFAHFVSWFATVDRKTAQGSWGTGWNGESLPANVCQSIGKNELRVAAAFWDLYDTKIDGVDSYANVKLLEVILEGNPPVYGSFTAMLGRFESAAGADWWKIEPIAEQNFVN